jgi:hypothetical protein
LPASTPQAARLPHQSGETKGDHHYNDDILINVEVLAIEKQPYNKCCYRTKKGENR